MITLKQWMETFKYRITEGDTYGWTCYGSNAQRLSVWNGLHDDGGWSGNIIFDTINQTVYEVEVCDYTNKRAYRIINSNFKKTHDLEAKSRSVDANEAWDCVRYVDLETDEDWLEKTSAIVAGTSYDTRVKVPLDLSKDELFHAMVCAHEQDITLNDYIQRILQQTINEQTVGK
jgi:hypothetical protein